MVQRISSQARKTAAQRYYTALNAELGFEFDLFALQHPRWMEANIPNGAVVVMQTDDPAFNRWARELTRQNNAGRKPRPPVVLVHVRKLRERKSRIVEAKAELLGARRRA